VVNIVLSLYQPAQPTFTGESSQAQIRTFLAGALTYVVLALIALFVAFLFTQMITGALSTAISARYLGQPITIAQAYQNVGMKTFLAIGGAAVLTGIGIALGTLALFVGAVYLFLRWRFF